MVLRLLSQSKGLGAELGRDLCESVRGNGVPAFCLSVRESINFPLTNFLENLELVMKSQILKKEHERIGER